MNKLLGALIALMITVSLSAQQKTRPEIKASQPKSDLPVLKSGIKPLTSNSQKRNVVNYANYSQNHFLGTDYSIKVIQANETGIPQWFSADIQQDKSKSVDANIKTWIEATSSMQQLDLDKNHFAQYTMETDNLGFSHHKMDQYHNGVRVYDAEIVLHAKGGAVAMQNGNAIASYRLPDNVTPSISSTEAKTIVQNNFPEIRENWNPVADKNLLPEMKQWEEELVFYNIDGTYRLAHSMLVYAHIGDRKAVIVDAHTGELLQSWSTICHIDHNERNGFTCHHDHGDHSNASEEKTVTTDNQKSSVLDGPEIATANDLFNIPRTFNTYDVNGTFFMIDASRDMFRPDLSNLPDEPIGAIWTIDANNSPVGGNIRYSHVANNDNRSYSREAVSAHYNAGQSYEYFRNTHNRNSMSGDGQTIVSFINIADENGNSFGQAFFNGAGIWYGNGDSSFFPLGRGLDVAGHELSHGVVQASAGLIYMNESGAINESYADIFGAMIDRDDWLIGEDVVRLSAFPSGALRNMEDPSNGAQTGDFGNGWQPSHFNERFTGTADNGGVHINSGIPNNAYYRFAIAVGKDMAEQVFYRALVTYLTRSSGFEELRFAVEQSAVDLFGQNIANVAGQAFADVGIGTASNTDFEQDFEINGGGDFLLASSDDQTDIFIFDLDSGQNVFTGAFSTTDHISKPSITDDGSRVVFVGTDNHVYLVDLDWGTFPPALDERIISNSPDWRNAVISRDGNRIALLEELRNGEEDNSIIVFDLVSNTSAEFVLFNPSFTDGVETGNVAFADAMEFDHTGNVIMYDALNVIESTFGGSDVEYWDIGFLTVWNPNINGFPITDEVNKLFGSLPETVSIGNPTFSKNSPFIIAFDVFEDLGNGNVNNSVRGMNIESYDQVVTLQNEFLAFPNYSRTDEQMVYDGANAAGDGLFIIPLAEDKITSTSSEQELGQGLRWGTWFSTGTRQLTAVNELEQDNQIFAITPSPVRDFALIELDLESVALDQDIRMEVINLQGQQIMSQMMDPSALQSYKLDTADMSPGSYVLRVSNGQKVATRLFVKI